MNSDQAITDQKHATVVRVPADVDLEDRLAFGLTGKQLMILAASAVSGYGGYMLLHLALTAQIALAAPALIAAGGLTVALVRRDGLSGDQLALAAARYLLAPKQRLLAPDGLPTPLYGSPPGARVAPLDLPITRILRSGLVELSDGSYRRLLNAQGASFQLRPAGEQAAFVTAFARLLNGLQQPIQILIRSDPASLEPYGQQLDNASSTLTGGLRAAALDHADYLRSLSGGTAGPLRRRQIVLVLRSPRGDPELAQAELSQAADHAIETLAGAQVLLHPLDGEQAAALLARALNPPGPPPGSHLEGVIHAAAQPSNPSPAATTAVRAEPGLRAGAARPARARAAHRPRPRR